MGRKYKPKRAQKVRLDFDLGSVEMDMDGDIVIDDPVIDDPVDSFIDVPLNRFDILRDNENEPSKETSESENENGNENQNEVDIEDEEEEEEEEEEEDFDNLTFQGFLNQDIDETIEPIQHLKTKKQLSKRRQKRKDARDAARDAARADKPEEKYTDSITVSEVLMELQTLVISPHAQEIRFPPLDANAHWYIEQLAQLHGLKARKLGKNKTKCIAVVKTNRSGPPTNMRLLNQLLNRRKTFPRTDIERSRSSESTRPKRTVLREGAVVGSGAQPVGELSIGHRLLTQMGWKEGSGLGTGGEGIRDPVAAVIKLSKQGLGVRP